MNVEAALFNHRGESRPFTISVDIGTGAVMKRAGIMLTFRPTGEWLYLDENHATALVLALQAAIAEVQARAVSL